MAKSQEECLPGNGDVATSEELTRSILDQAVEPILVCDEEGTILRASEAARRLAGEDLIGRAFDDVLPLQVHSGRFLCLSAGQRPVGERDGGRCVPAFPCGQTIRGLEAAFHRRDGRVFHLLFSAGPLMNDRDELIGGVVTLTDITKGKEMITESRRTQANLLRRNRQLEILSRINRQLNAVLEIPVVLRTLVTSAMELVDAESGKSGRLVEGKMVFTEYNQKGHIIPIDYAFEAGYGVPGHVIETGEPYLSNDVEHDPYMIPEIQQRLNIYNLVSTPIFNRQGEMLGCLEMHNKRGHRPFDEQDLLVLEGLAASAAVAMENAQSIADRHAAQASLRESERRMVDIINFLPDVTFAIDREGKVIAWNRAAEKLTGIGAKTMLGKNGYAYALPFYGKRRPMLIDLVLTPELQKKKYYDKLKKDKDVIMAENFAPGLHDGAGGYIWGRASPLLGANGEVLGAIESIRDVTERKQSADELLRYREHLRDLVQERTAELRDSNDKLQQEIIERKKTEMELADALARAQSARREAETAHARYRLLLESAPDGIVVMGEDGRISLINAQAEKMFGYRQDELIGKSMEVLIPEQFRQEHLGYRTKYMEAPRTRLMGAGLDLYGRRKDGSVFPIEISLSPSRGEAGAMVTAIVHDISQRQRVQDQIKRLNEDLKRRATELEVTNQELESFSYSVSHDLRAPLRTIDGFSQSILEDCGPQLDEMGREYLARIRAATRHMAQLIEDILNLSRVTRQEMHREPVDLTAMVQAIIAELQAGQPNRRVRFVIAPDVTARGDATLFRIALSNLLANAWKFTSHHAEALIEFGVKKQGDQTVYFVRDNGAGFNMAYARKLFAPFQRLHTSKEFPGTGIGLATVQRIIRRHGGRVWAEGQVEKGATFYFTLNAADRDCTALGETSNE